MTKTETLYNDIMKNVINHFDSLILVTVKRIVVNTILITSNPIKLQNEHYTYDFITPSVCDVIVKRNPNATYDVKPYLQTTPFMTTLLNKIDVHVDLEMLIDDVIDDYTDDLNDETESLSDCLRDQLDDYDIELDSTEFTVLLNLVATELKNEI